MTDVIFIIKQGVGDRGALSVFNGLQYKSTVMVIDQEFVFDRYIFAHEFGHIIGCGHEFGSSNYLAII